MTHPIVLAHGIAPFDQLLHDVAGTDRPDSGHYFRNIKSTLEDEGFEVHHSRVAFARSVDVRSRELKENLEGVLERTGAEKLHVIAHSMGGLDARHALFDSRDDASPLHERVASVTTISTPHCGTSFADWGIEQGDLFLRFLARLGIDSLDGFKDLTRPQCEAFNERAESFEQQSGVTFRTYAGAQELHEIFFPLALPWIIIHREEGANDGLVSVKSARWHDDYFQRVLDADHLNEVGWWDPNELGRRFFHSPDEERESRRQMEARIRRAYVEMARSL